MINTALVSFGMSGKLFHAPFIDTNPQSDAVIRWVSPLRLSQVETAFAMTVHKSQGSEFDEVLAQFDAHARLVPVPAKASVTCSDADDQMFIDLAVAYRSTLLSKDNAVTSMAKRLLALNARVQKTL